MSSVFANGASAPSNVREGENGASWAYKFQRDYNQKTKDLDDVYFDIKDAEQRRKKKGLPPRVAILPGWDISDEDRYDEKQAEKRKQAARKKAIAAKQHKANSGGSKKRSQAASAHRPGGEAKR